MRYSNWQTTRKHHPKLEYLYATSLANVDRGPLFYCQGQWRASWGLHDLIYLPSIVVAASQLLGKSAIVQLWYDEVMMKAPRIGPCIHWQQHYARWQHTRPVNHITAVVALDTLTKDRSALCLIPGSHRWRDGKLLDVPSYDASRDEAAHMNSIYEIVNDEEREILMDMPPQTMELKRGQVMFVHPLTVYATHGNPFVRLCEMCVHPHDGAPPPYTTQPGPVLPKSTRFAADAVIRGPYFPVLFDPSMVDEPVSLPEGDHGAIPVTPVEQPPK